jgi:hypothetical protein
MFWNVNVREIYYKCKIDKINVLSYRVLGVLRWRSWLRHCPATSRKVACSITDGVIQGCFYLLYPSGLTMALGSTQPRAELSTSGISWRGGGKGGGCLELTTLPLLCVYTSGSLKVLETFGPLQACNRITFYLYLTSYYLRVPTV